MGCITSSDQSDWFTLPPELKCIVLQYIININQTIIEIIDCRTTTNLQWLSVYHNRYIASVSRVTFDKLPIDSFSSLQYLLYVVNTFNLEVKDGNINRIAINACNYNDSDMLTWCFNKQGKHKQLIDIDHLINWSIKCDYGRNRTEILGVIVKAMPWHVDSMIRSAILGDRLRVVGYLCGYNLASPDTTMIAKLYIEDKIKRDKEQEEHDTAVIPNIPQFGGRGNMAQIYPVSIDYINRIRNHPGNPRFRRFAFGDSISNINSDIKNNFYDDNDLC